MDTGVTSTCSSAEMYSTALSRVSSNGGLSPMTMPLVADRMFVSCLSLQTFTRRSPGRWCTPTIMSL